MSQLWGSRSKNLCNALLSLGLITVSTPVLAISFCTNDVFSVATKQFLDETSTRQIFSEKIIVTVVKATFKNAFATPNGNIIFTTDLLDSLHSPESYAAILMHEIGHLALKHFQKSQVERGVDALFSNQFGGLLSMLGRAQLSQEKEIEADQFSVRALGRLGIDPSVTGVTLGAVVYGPPNDVGVLFGSHPDSQTRKQLALGLAKSVSSSERSNRLPPWAKFTWVCSES